MGSEIDVNEIAAAYMTANTASLLEAGIAWGANAKAFVRSKFARTYHDYLIRLLERYSRSKSFFVRRELVPLHEFFVPLDLSSERQHLQQPDSEEVADVSSAVIISGSGGSGKSLMMRHLLISTLVNKAKTPIFLELRTLNEHPVSIREALLRTLRAFGLKVDDSYLELALEAGHFAVFLDGFDELEHVFRISAASEIQALIQRYPKNRFIISSRGDDRLRGWEDVVELAIQPMRLDASIELVEKLPFGDDGTMAQSFADQLRNGLYREHYSFASHPLLLSILVLTYSDAAHIPRRLSGFYEQAYESLFQKHDALKGGFERHRRSNLDIQGFAKVFAAFCVSTYNPRTFTFSRSHAQEHFDRAKGLTQLEYRSEFVLDDAIQAVCLLLEDGLDIAFAHRSFQEYFVARFIGSCPSELKGPLVKLVGTYNPVDAVLPLLFEIDQYTVEREYVLPEIAALKASLRIYHQCGISHFVRFIRQTWSQFVVPEFPHEFPDWTDIATRTLREIPFIARFYGLNLGGRMDDNEWRALHKHLRADFGAGTIVKVSTLTSKHSTVRYLFEKSATTVGSGGYIRGILDLEQHILARHREASVSVERLLLAADPE